ncbi:MAG TPA: reverse transcriptase domain-containing protein [Thermoanaerobaculia bacterium]
MEFVDCVGGVISPLLSNIYLHYVFDLWVQQWRKRTQGDVIVVRWADDFIVGFQHRYEAERFLAELRMRFAKFGLTLHPEKTRLIEFGRFAAQDRKDRGDGKPESFNFLGLTHICGRTMRGIFTVRRQTMRTRWRAKLKELGEQLRFRRHDPIPKQGAYVGAVVRGHVNYYGVPWNSPAIGAFRMAVGRAWHKALERRSQKARLPWARMKKYIDRWLPPARVCHPFPSVRFFART